MPHGYCTECDARVTVIDGCCLLGHLVDPATISNKRGRRIAAGVGEQRGSVAVLERPTIAEPSPTRPSDQDIVVPRARARAAEPIQHRTVVEFDELNPTGDVVVTLWDTIPPGEDLADWTPERPLSSLPERNPIRWLSAALVVLAVAALLGAIALMVNQGRSAREALSADAASLAEAVSRFDATSPSPDFAAIDAPARALLTAAERLDVGDAQRAVAIDASTRVLEGERELAEALSYQTGFSVFVGRPDLPTSVDEAGLSDVSAAFTSWTSDLDGVLQSAPSDPAFATHRENVSAFGQAMMEVQSAYLDALRSGDAAEAAQHLATVDSLVGDLDASLGAAINASQRGFSTSLDEVARMLQRLTSTD